MVLEALTDLGPLLGDGDLRRHDGEVSEESVGHPETHLLIDATSSGYIELVKELGTGHVEHAGNQIKF